MVGPGDVVTFQPDTIHSVVTRARESRSRSTSTARREPHRALPVRPGAQLEKPFLLKIAPLVLDSSVDLRAARTIAMPPARAPGGCLGRCWTPVRCARYGQRPRRGDHDVARGAGLLRPGPQLPPRLRLDRGGSLVRQACGWTASRWRGWAVARLLRPRRPEAARRALPAESWRPASPREQRRVALRPAARGDGRRLERGEAPRIQAGDRAACRRRPTSSCGCCAGTPRSRRPRARAARHGARRVASTRSALTLAPDAAAHHYLVHSYETIGRSEALAHGEAFARRHPAARPSHVGPRPPASRPDRRGDRRLPATTSWRRPTTPPSTRARARLAPRPQPRPPGTATSTAARWHAPRPRCARRRPCRRRRPRRVRQKLVDRSRGSGDEALSRLRPDAGTLGADAPWTRAPATRTWAGACPRCRAALEAPTRSWPARKRPASVHGTAVGRRVGVCEGRDGRECQTSRRRSAQSRSGSRSSSNDAQCGARAVLG